MNPGPVLQMVRLQFNAILGKRGVRSLALVAALLLFTKGCDSVFVISRAFAPAPAGEGMPTPVEQGFLMFRYMFFFVIITMFGFLMTTAVGAFAVETDIRQKYIVNVLSKPLSRAQYLMGKILAATLFIVLYCAVGVGLFLLNFHPGRKDLNGDFWTIFGMLFVLLFTQFAIALTLSLVFHPIAAGLLSIALAGLVQVLTPILFFAADGSFTDRAASALYALLPSLDQINLPLLGAKLANPLLTQIGFRRLGGASEGLIAAHNLLYAAALLTLYALAFRRKSVVPS